MALLTHTLGYPRIGTRRELKKALESFWEGKLSQQELLSIGSQLRKEAWLEQTQQGIALPASNDFSLYDHVLDALWLVGAIPPRFGQLASEPKIDWEVYFRMARGAPGVAPLELTKWFDTNYHYLVPEWHDARFCLCSHKPVEEWREARQLGIETKPVFLGPLTLLLLGKPQERLAELLPPLCTVYRQLFAELAREGVRWVQLDEPFLCTELPSSLLEAYRSAYAFLAEAEPRPNLLLATYFGELAGNWTVVRDLPWEGIHVDGVRAAHELPPLLATFPKGKVLSLGVVDGRNVWKNDYARSLALLEEALGVVGENYLWVGPSSSLLHVPLSLEKETKLDRQIVPWLAFAREKLGELAELADLATRAWKQDPRFLANQEILRQRKSSPLVTRPEVRSRLASLNPSLFRRKNPYPIRRLAQRSSLHLPPLPTTTIGSFPQTPEVRKARAKWKSGEWSQKEYETFVENEIKKVIELQESLGLDVLVHGEFERTDMVEYFGELLEGFVLTENGWVQSYGSRCVKPPILYGDVSRSRSMTLRWIRYAQTQTQKPLKGMLTGPITILRWSFVRDDLGEKEVAYQLALCLRDEVCELESAGIRVIQVDEPALREGLPLRKSQWPAYLEWAVGAFRLATSGVEDRTQIHTHMCYSDFGDIWQAIVDLDADVISLEAARSGFSLLELFTRFPLPNEIGPGVWDVHSPRIPTVEEIYQALLHMARAVSPDRLWVNPDCGLKTRSYKEVVPSLRNMVEAARKARETLLAKKDLERAG
ncbi:5-methyltetrahydropteroyltriglutamate--homocysteine S-methyltransferase [Candidatus Methylacidithermus pantelleriae]|uniref:5-methyltetrahydropteroyltriglutamate--homocysteine methyltransferase n=1 Tax=Candidatus Methylacidithermus pantelleriae TaxID=2744239 RepID=A0A8J2FQQ1_9BACT|nr:5-methyltetrahydropteroyltriglutamate--homocysteine S-methyltransferase [Candidatus Methylacidithermus pantelleriae]CAF0699078.1 5-methyltetrahydropteroyltriglutamate--homocysteine methyltransferase [Candidatus Methylacidithermus pantelleriae]